MNIVPIRKDVLKCGNPDWVVKCLTDDELHEMKIALDEITRRRAKTIH